MLRNSEGIGKGRPRRNYRSPRSQTTRSKLGTAKQPFPFNSRSFCFSRAGQVQTGGPVGVEVRQCALLKLGGALDALGHEARTADGGDLRGIRRLAVSPLPFRSE